MVATLGNLTAISDLSDPIHSATFARKLRLARGPFIAACFGNDRTEKWNNSRPVALRTTGVRSQHPCSTRERELRLIAKPAAFDDEGQNGGAIVRRRRVQTPVRRAIGSRLIQLESAHP